MSASKTYQIETHDGKVLLLLGNCAGGLTMIRVDAYLKLLPDDAKWLANELAEAAMTAEADAEAQQQIDRTSASPSTPSE